MQNKPVGMPVGKLHMAYMTNIVAYMSVDKSLGTGLYNHILLFVDRSMT